MNVQGYLRVSNVLFYLGNLATLTSVNSNSITAPIPIVQVVLLQTETSERLRTPSLLYSKFLKLFHVQLARRPPIPGISQLIYIHLGFIPASV